MTGLTSGNLPVAMAYVTDITPPEKRAGGLGLIGGAISLGFIVGPALGGLLGGRDAASANLLWPALVAAAVCLLTCLAAHDLSARDPDPGTARESRRVTRGTSQLAMTRRVLSKPVLAQMVLVGFMVYTAMALFETVFRCGRKRATSGAHVRWASCLPTSVCWWAPCRACWSGAWCRSSARANS